MEKISNLKDLLIEQIRELYHAENQQRDILLTMTDHAYDDELKVALRDHIDETDQQINRLEQVFQQLDIASFGEHSEAMKGLILECRDLVERSADPEVTDAAIVAAVQFMKHFEIAGYGSACTFANELGLKDIADSLHLSLAEEKAFDDFLSEIATEQINVKAISPVIT